MVCSFPVRRLKIRLSYLINIVNIDKSRQPVAWQRAGGNLYSETFLACHEVMHSIQFGAVLAVLALLAVLVYPP
ncbi:hypothetical protein A2300_01615 [Candidatus Falkowbacteria bacterium RIFOXYB2_FULL_35_7]|nr:MAG: hypothetical protein A2300_01615 [Candidatus Falkowbacteria bacterium RIFOXYB2_FULL_35_7]